MPDWLPPLLTLLFLAHLVAFVRLAIMRGERYYWLVTVLFVALTLSFAVRWLAPGSALGGQPLHLWLRWLAWAIAAVTVPMLITRIRRRRSN